MFTYHVSDALSIQGVRTEIEKRAKEGWRLVTAYPEPSGQKGTRHMLIFEKPLS